MDNKTQPVFSFSSIPPCSLRIYLPFDFTGIEPKSWLVAAEVCGAGAKPDLLSNWSMSAKLNMAYTYLNKVTREQPWSVLPKLICNGNIQQLRIHLMPWGGVNSLPPKSTGPDRAYAKLLLENNQSGSKRKMIIVNGALEDDCGTD